MPVDILNEDIVSLTEATKVIPPLDGRRMHPATVWRHCRRGLPRRGGRVFLEYARVGNRIITSKQALNRFYNSLAAADRAEDASPIEREAAKCHTPVTKSRTPAQRQKAIARARKELAEAGV